MRLLLLACLVAVALAGCSAGPSETTTTTTSTTEAPVPSWSAVAMQTCEQFHTFFPSPAQLFESFVPENFTMKTDDAGQTTTIPVLASVCNDGNYDMWALLQVVPPEPLRNASFQVDAVVLQAFVTNSTHHAQYLAWGLAPDLLIRATIRETEFVSAGAAATDRVALGEGDLKFSVRTTTQTAPAPYAPASYRYWITNGTMATGWIQAENANGTELGAGTAFFESQGDSGAPPASTGIGHRVAGVNVRNLRYSL